MIGTGVFTLTSLMATTAKTLCVTCGRATHPTEMIYHATLGWACLRCVEDTRVVKDG